MPLELKQIPISEFRVMLRYYLKTRKEIEELNENLGSDRPTDGAVIG